MVIFDMPSIIAISADWTLDIPETDQVYAYKQCSYRIIIVSLQTTIREDACKTEKKSSLGVIFNTYKNLNLFFHVQSHSQIVPEHQIASPLKGYTLLEIYADRNCSYGEENVCQ